MIATVSRARGVSTCPGRGILRFPRVSRTLRTSAVGQQSRQAVQNIIKLVADKDRGLISDAQCVQEVMKAVELLAEESKSLDVIGEGQLSATWKLLWTTEKETLFILKNAGVFGTKSGEVYQVIDTDAGRLQNVITFPPEGSFVVDSALKVAGPRRCEFKFNSATLNLPAGRNFKLPPFGQGWFDTVYMDNDVRIACDIRGDVLVVTRDGPPRTF